jgi:hypothetical protein
MVEESCFHFERSQALLTVNFQRAMFNVPLSFTGGSGDGQPPGPTSDVCVRASAAGLRFVALVHAGIIGKAFGRAHCAGLAILVSSLPAAWQVDRGLTPDYVVALETE